MIDVYVHHLNIQRFERLLEEEADPEKRRLLQRLLDEERAKDPGEPTRPGLEPKLPDTP